MTEVTLLDTEVLKARVNGLTEQAGTNYLRNLLDISQAEAVMLHKQLFPQYHNMIMSQVS